MPTKKTIFAVFGSLAVLAIAGPSLAQTPATTPATAPEAAAKPPHSHQQAMNKGSQQMHDQMMKDHQAGMQKQQGQSASPGMAGMSGAAGNANATGMAGMPMKDCCKKPMNKTMPADKKKAPMPMDHM